MTTNAYLDRIQALAPREGLSLGAMHGASRADFALLMAAAALTFASGRTYSEREINEGLRQWLAGPGSMLAVDHVELRRWLVDMGVFTRDGYGRAYERATPPPEIDEAMVNLEGHDLDAVVREARSRHAADRASRKAKWSTQRPRIADAKMLRERRAELVELLADAVIDGASVGFVLPLDLAAIGRFWDGIAADVDRGERVVFVVEREGRIAGGVQLAPCQKPNGTHRAEVQKLLVRRNARRAGLGRVLMEAAEAHAAASGWWLLLLDTREASVADGMYRASGWTAFGHVPDYARDPDGTLAGCAFFYKRLR
jgi:GNAT superfamily N-acetyltransferase